MQGVIASGNVVVLVDIDGVAKTMMKNPAQGLWRSFKDTVCTEGFNQAFLRFHSAPVAIVEVCHPANVLVTCESGQSGQLCVWDLNDGTRVTVIRPHQEW